MVQNRTIPPPTKDSYEIIQNENEDRISTGEIEQVKTAMKQTQLNLLNRKNQHSIKNSNEVKEFKSSSYPNPFNPSTKINFYLPQNDAVTIEIYNELGAKIKTLVSTSFNLGEHSVDFNGSNLSSGIYYYKISTGLSGTQINKMILVK